MAKFIPKEINAISKVHQAFSKEHISI